MFFFYLVGTHTQKYFHLKEHTLVATKKALHHYNLDLELFFKSKHNAKVDGDGEFVKFAFDQINC